MQYKNMLIRHSRRRTAGRLFRLMAAAVVLAGLTASCSWLDVGSRSEVDEDEMYTTADGYYTTLTGLYLNMGTTTLYGGNLPLYALEPLTQQYTVSSNEPDRVAWTQYNYSTDTGQTLVADIWLKMYNTIVNCNLLLSRLGQEQIPAMEEGVADIMRGEALGLRTYMYFDLVRLFNESYAVNPDSRNVPCKLDFGFGIGQQMTTAQLLDQLMNDLTEARRLLQADPLLGQRTYSDRYVSYSRQQRMNHDAVTALMARIELYRGHYEEAARYAKEVIQTGRYRFIEEREIIATDAYGAEQKVDRVFMPEIIFALYTDNVLTTSRSYYEGLTQDFVKSTAAYDDGDVRTAWFFSNPSAKGSINLIRYQRSTLTQDAHKYGDPVVPMLKLSEMYLIAAESELRSSGDEATAAADALSLVNTMRTARGETELAAGTTRQDLLNAITHEYICDFKGEGQLFYYYKRNNMTSVDNGYANGNTTTIPVKAYTLPLPDYENQFGYGTGQ